MSDLVSLLDNRCAWELGPMWRRFAGDPAIRPAGAGQQARSPLHRKAQARGPILLLHVCAYDPRVSRSTSRCAWRRRCARPAAVVELEILRRCRARSHRWPDQLRYYRRTEDFGRLLKGRSAGFDLFEPAAWVPR